MSLPRIDEGKYEILQKLKEGGMGAIYKVRHRLLEEVRVIKVIRPQFADDEELRSRFFREARTATRLRHNHIAHLFDFTVGEDGSAYIVMEYIDGVTLQEMLSRHGPVGLGLTLEIADQALEALGYLHHHKFVHRDVAPDNLMLTRTFDGRPLVKLIDLGIAKRLEGNAPQLTVQGAFLGKVRYSSPEQFGHEKGADALDHRSDVYSFGVMLYELLTGANPIQGSTIDQIIAGHLFRPPRDFAETDPEGRIPEGLRQVVLAALAKDPDERIAGTRELRDALAPFREGPAELDLELDLEQTLLDTTRLVDDPGRSGSSIQRRVDEGFAVDRTPGAGTPLPEADRKAPESTASRVEALLENARLLTRLEQFDKADHELDRLEVLAPGHSEVAELKEVVERGRRAKGEAERRREQQERQERVDALLAEAQKLAAGNDLAEATVRLEKVVQIDPAHTAARRLLDSLRDDLRRRRAAERREETEARIAELLEVGRLAEAEDALAQAIRDADEPESFNGLAARLQSAQTAARVADLLAAARRHRDSGDLDLALATAEAAVQLAPADGAALALKEELATAAEERRREAEHEEAILARAREVADLLAEDRLDDAAAVLDDARSELGEDTAFGALHDRVDRRRRERELEERLAAVRDHLAAERPEDAAAALAAAREMAPGDEAVEQLAAELAALEERLEARAAAEREEREAAARAEAARTIAEALDRGDLDDAGRRLAAARFQHGDGEELEAMATRLDALREERRREVEAREAEARRHLDADEPDADALDAAATALDRLEALAPEHPELEALRTRLAGAREALARRQEAEERRRQLTEAASGIAATLAGGDLDRAEKELGFALDRFADHPEAAATLSPLAKRLATARQEAEEAEEAARRAEEERAAREAAEKAERDAKAKVEREAAEKAERERREAEAKAEREAAEKAERERREAEAKAEREAAEKAERKAAARAERQAERERREAGEKTAGKAAGAGTAEQDHPEPAAATAAAGAAAETAGAARPEAAGRDSRRAGRTGAAGAAADGPHAPRPAEVEAVPEAASGEAGSEDDRKPDRRRIAAVAAAVLLVAVAALAWWTLRPGTGAPGTEDAATAGAVSEPAGDAAADTGVDAAGDALPRPGRPETGTPAPSPGTAGDDDATTADAAPPAPLPDGEDAPEPVVAEEEASPAAAPTGFLVLDAIPWARVERIEGSDGQPVRLAGSSPYTPLRLSLPAGRYVVSLSHPEAARPTRVTVDVPAAGTAERTVTLHTIDPDEYLRRAGWNLDSER